MSQILVLRFPMPVALALIAMLLILLGVARMLATLGKPVPLRRPHEQHDPIRPAEYEQGPH